VDRVRCNPQLPEWNYGGTYEFADNETIRINVTSLTDNGAEVCESCKISQGINNNIIIIIIITTTIFIVLSSTAPAICESSLWFIWAKVGQRQVAANSQAKLQT